MAQITQFDLISEQDKPFVDEFLNSLTQLRCSSKNGYRNSLGLFYLCLDDLAVSQVKKAKRKHITYWLQELNKRNYAATSNIHHIFHIRLYLSWLKEMKYIRKDPQVLILKTDLPKLPKMLPRPLSPTVDQKLIEYFIQSDQLLDKCLLLMRYTGLRISDLLNLEYDSILADDKGLYYLRGISLKFDKQYSIPIENKTVELIKWIQLQSKNIFLEINPSSFPSKLVNDSKGRQMAGLIRVHLATISSAVADITITPHQLRHTFATSLINGGMGLYSVMKLLGHADLRMTLRYAELYPETLHREFHGAMVSINEQYQIKTATVVQSTFDPVQALTDVNRWVKNLEGINPKELLPVSKRISRIKSEVEAIVLQSKHAQ